MSTSPKTNGLWTMTKGEFEESVATLERAVVSRGGSPRKLFDRLRTDGNFTNRVAEFMLRGAVQASPDQKLARAILGPNFFGLEEWSTLYGRRFTKRQERELADFPWDEHILNGPCPFVEGKTMRETHFAFLGLDHLGGQPLTIIGWQRLHPSTGQPRFLFDPEPWYSDSVAATESKCQFRWYLMLKEIVPKSVGKAFAEQEAMLHPEYEVPKAVEEVTKAILYYRKNGVFLNTSRWSRCSDHTPEYRMMVGRFGAGLNVYNLQGDGIRDHGVGVGASRKLPSRNLKQ